MCSPLPDISRLEALPAAIWRDFGRRVSASGLMSRQVPCALQRRPTVHDRLQAPLLMWHARRRRDPYGYAYRMLILRDPVTEGEAIAVLGPALLREFSEAGLFTRTEQSEVVSAFNCRLYRGLIILCDDLTYQHDAVFGTGPGSAAFCRPSTEHGLADRALDLGCGGGAVALWLSRHARHVVASDINPRALAFVRMNAAINNVTNVEARQGNWFEAVTGEAFDFISSQPPFVPRTADARPATYRLGGAKGNELVLDILLELPKHLTKTGRAMVVFEHPCTSGTTHNRDLALDGAGHMNTLLILGAEVDADMYSIRHAATELRNGAIAFDKAVTSMRQHLDEVGIGSLRPAICVVEHASESEGWAETVFAGDTLWDEVSAETIDRFLAVRVSLQRLGAGVPPGHLIIPAGSILARPIGPDGAPMDRLYLGLPPDYPACGLELTLAEWEALEAARKGNMPELGPGLTARAARAGLFRV
jgi:SAM-dependent methyltransferase